MNLAKFGSLICVTMFATIALVSCKKKDKEEQPSVPFTYPGEWATAKVMGGDVSTDVKTKATITLVTTAADLFLDEKVTENVDKVKTFTKEAITNTIELARGMKITLKEEGKACSVAFAGMTNPIDGTWTEQESKIILNLNNMQATSLQQLKDEAATAGTLKAKINFSFAQTISGKTIELTKKENNIVWTMDTDLIIKAISETASNQKIALSAELLGMVVNNKPYDIEFHKVK